MKKFNPQAANATVIEATVIEDTPTDAPAAPATTTALAQPSAGGGALAMIGDYQPPALPEKESGPPYLAFREKSTQDALLNKIVTSLGVVPEGTPVIVAGNQAFRTDGLAFALISVPGLEPLSYWATTGGENYRPDRVWFENPGLRKHPDGEKIKEFRQAILLVLPGTNPVPEALAPAALVSVRVGSAKVQAISDLNAATLYAQTAEWAKRNAKLAQVPTSFRMVGTLRVGSKPIKSGENKGGNYGTANMDCSPITVAQLDALAAWNALPTAFAQIEDAKRGHAFKLEELRTLAAATKPIA